MKKLLIPILSIAAALIFGGCAGYNNTSMAKQDTGMAKQGSMSTKMAAPFGSKEDVVYAKNMWNKMEVKGLNSTPANLYVGGPPHGQVREVLEGMIDGKLVIVKRNYYGKGITVDAVSKDRAKYLKSITIMAKREKGYDPEDADWFWIKYGADGNIMKNPKGMALAGKVAKGMPMGCISCHSSASGGNLVFAHNAQANAKMVFVK